jgi:hypothetical protein
LSAPSNVLNVCSPPLGEKVPGRLLPAHDQGVDSAFSES